jgi:hypothetical protein
VGRALKDIFGPDPATVFVPVIARDLDTFTLMTECYIFIRSDNPTKVGRLRRITGVQAVMAEADSTRITKFIQVEDSYVQSLIKQCWDVHYLRSKSIKESSWVRILDGETRDMCGTVVAIVGDRVMVQIDMKTKPVLVETSLHNLLDLSHVPVAHRVFYYSGPVQQFLEDQGVDAEAAIATDLNYDEDEVRAFLGQEDAPPPPPITYLGPSSARTHTSREQTATRLITSLIQGGEKDVRVLLTKTVEAIRGRSIKTPKTATILWHVLRQAVITHMFPEASGVKVYSDVIAKFGSSYRLTPKDVLMAIPELPLRPLAGIKVTETTSAPVPDPFLSGSLETITAMVRQVLQLGHYDLYTVLEAAQAKLLAGTVRAPKHLESLAHAIRTQVLKHFRSAHPTADIKVLAEIYGDGIRISPTSIRERFPQLEAAVLAKRATQVKPLKAIVSVTPVLSESMTIICRKPAQLRAFITETPVSLTT